MNDVMGTGSADAARNLLDTRQSGPGSLAIAAPQEKGAAGRSGHEGDSVTLSDAAQEALKVRTRDGIELFPIPLDKLKLITPQGQRGEAEMAIKQLMSDLDIEGDLEFSIKLRDDGSIAVQGAGDRNAELEAAINADPALQKLMRNNQMTAKFLYSSPMMKELFSGGDGQSPDREALKAASAARDRIEVADFVFSLSDGALTTTFEDPAGERFGGLAPATPS